ncbi:hypothetical protein Fot_37497 [Forsythia ovata]|uniref:Uncharacterized protein n=1 Tax=Forsythia ovata TaxID=205694 RepID=A0ABD1RZ71_9LAMI
MLIRSVQSGGEGIKVCVAPQEEGEIFPIFQRGVTRLHLAFLESSTSSSSSMTLSGTAFYPSSMITLFSLSGRWTFSRGRVEEVGTVTFSTDRIVVEISTATSGTNETMVAGTDDVHCTGG